MVAVHEGEIASAQLGLKVEIWDEDGNNVEESGQSGELVVTTPFFSMPTTFWGEDGDKKYRRAYFEKYPDIWVHGDFIQRNPKTGGYTILGRSDGVLNPGGELHFRVPC